jgi:hypothetical protein
MGGKHRGGKTLAEHDALLKAEGRYDALVEQKKRRDLELEARKAELDLAQAPLLADLLAAGYSMTSVWDLVNTTEKYADAIPVLFVHLQRAYPVPIREGIARALAVPEAKYGWQVILERYRIEQDQRVKAGLAAAIAVLADAKVVDEVIALARDSTHGPSRILLLEALVRSREVRAQATFADLASDPELAVAVAQIQRRRSRDHSRAKRSAPR